jgi:hypothetical protein
MILGQFFLTSFLSLYGICNAKRTFSNVRERSQFVVAMRDTVAKEHGIVNDPADAFHNGIMSKAQYLSFGFREEITHQGSEMQNWYRRRVEDAVDNVDDNADDNSYYYNAQNYGDYGFNITQYSLKYHSCVSLTFYNEDDNQQGNSQDEGNSFSSLFRTQSFAILKLCPSHKCLDNSWYGCKSEYGEYMLPLQDYLVASNTYQESVAYSYCNYCQQCLYFEKYFYDSGNNNTHACKYYEACYSYKSVCNDYGGDDDAKDDGYINFAYDDFFECMKVDGVGNDDNNAVFLGPYCNPKDHKTISIGVFADEWCTQYIGDQISIYDATGMAMKEHALSMHYTPTCTSCHESSLPYNIIEEDMDDSDLVVEYCEDVYMSAAKCNVNLDLPTSYASGQSYQEKVHEAMECSFIQNVVKGNYDGYGFMYVDSSNSEVYEPTLSDRVNEIKEVLTTGYDEVTKFQIFCILLFSVGSVILVITSIFLKKVIYKAHNPLAHVNYDDDKIMEMRSHDNDGAFA